jgi:hypothetical protein
MGAFLRRRASHALICVVSADGFAQLRACSARMHESVPRAGRQPPDGVRHACRRRAHGEHDGAEDIVAAQGFDARLHADRDVGDRRLVGRGTPGERVARQLERVSAEIPAKIAKPALLFTGYLNSGGAGGMLSHSSCFAD